VRVLITGAGGFVGSGLAASLRREGHEVTGTIFHTSRAERPSGERAERPSGERAERPSGEPAPTLDVRDAHEVDRLVERVRPDWACHLAAQSSAGLSWKEPTLTYSVNVAGTHLVLDALRRYSPRCRVLVTATSDEYGRVDPALCPLDEDAPLRPLSPYAASKVAQEWVARTFFEAFGLEVVITRAFMHIGPGQPPSFATADWARQIALAEAGLGAPVVEVGDLSLAREFGDVRDVVRAYRLVLEHGVAGEPYNVATGGARALGDALGILLQLARVHVEVRIEPAKIRPADPPLLTGSAAKLERLAGWKPEHRLEDTLAEVLDYWRARVRPPAPGDRSSPHDEGARRTGRI